MQQGRIYEFFGGLGSKSAGIVIILQSTRKKTSGVSNPLPPPPPPWIRHCAGSISASGSKLTSHGEVLKGPQNTHRRHYDTPGRRAFHSAVPSQTTPYCLQIKQLQDISDSCRCSLHDLSLLHPSMRNMFIVATRHHFRACCRRRWNVEHNKRNVPCWQLQGG